METNKGIARLIAKFISGTLTEEENQELNAWLEASGENRDLFNHLTSHSYVEGLRKIAAIDVDDEWEQISRRIIRPRKNKYQMAKYAVAAAAAVIVAFILFGFPWSDKAKNKQDISPAIVSNIATKSETQSPANTATLVFEDGRRIDLDSLQKDTILTQGSSTVIIKKGVIEYRPNKQLIGNGKVEAENFNTLITRGGQYQIILPDSSKVWLNDASTFHYSTEINPNGRTSSLQGEAYFEVSSLKSPSGKRIPFSVWVDTTNIEVLGTHFNIRGYKDEANIKTTLIKGSVRVVRGDKKVLLKPGEQAQVDTSGSFKLINNVDLDEVIAWKNGSFDFFKTPLNEIMRQVKRRYDVDVEYETDSLRTVTTAWEKSLPLTDALAKLEYFTSLKFKTSGRKIIVQHKQSSQ